MYKSNIVTMVNSVMLCMLLGVITNMYCINALTIPRDNVHIEYANVENMTVYEDMVNDDQEEYIPIDIDLNECVKDDADCIIGYIECIPNYDDCISKYNECMVTVIECNIKNIYSSPNTNENVSFIDLNVMASNIKLGDFAKERDTLIVNFKQYINAITKLYDTSSSCYNETYDNYNDNYTNNNLYIFQIAKNINKTVTNIYNIVDSKIASLDMLYADKEIRDFLDLWIAYRIYGMSKYIDQILHFTTLKYDTD